jgi:hypothetical protein
MGEGAGVGLFKRRRKDPAGGIRQATSADIEHLQIFARSRDGVEAFIEPRTAVTETTLVLVAGTGEWTRRRIAGPDEARRLSKKEAIPLYDVGVVGYPQRMRDWTEMRKRAGDVGPPGLTGPSI